MSTGFLARALFQLRHDETSKYHIYGIGNWNELDTKYIYHLVHAKVKGRKDSYAAKASFSITPEFCTDKIQDIEIILRTLKPLYPTIRIIRQFQLEGNRFEQINRIDWDTSKETLENPESKEQYEKASKTIKEC